MRIPKIIQKCSQWSLFYLQPYQMWWRPLETRQAWKRTQSPTWISQLWPDHSYLSMADPFLLLHLACIFQTGRCIVEMKCKRWLQEFYRKYAFSHHRLVTTSTRCFEDVSEAVRSNFKEKWPKRSKYYAKSRCLNDCSPKYLTAFRQRILDFFPQCVGHRY